MLSTVAGSMAVIAVYGYWRSQRLERRAEALEAGRDAEAFDAQEQFIDSVFAPHATPVVEEGNSA